MSRDHRLQKLLASRHIWCPGDLSASVRNSVPSGFSLLDQRIGGGWPTGVLTELLLEAPGLGELRLLLPALARLSEQSERAGYIVWVAPPHIPYVPAFTQFGLDISRMLIVRADNQADVLWAMEQALRSSVCIALLGWLAKADERSLRRLQLAAETSGCWTLVFRHARFSAGTSPAPLRISLAPSSSGVDLRILRNRYGPLGSFSVKC